MSSMTPRAEAHELDQASIEALASICGRERTLTRWIDRIAYASDASFYHLVPKAVIQPRSEAEIRDLMAWARAHSLPLTFRTAGTSLSGQAITDGLLIDLSKHWRALEVLEQGAAVRVQPGVIGAHVNTLLRPYGSKIGPDPASIQACMIGGILANNASGMCCGVAQNAYHTLRSLRLMLPDGQVFDTADSGAEAAFSQARPDLAAGLLALRADLLTDEALCARIRAKYRQKNTTGYSLNALLDYETPLAILAHLLIGSEGSLALISEAVLDTVPDRPFKDTGLLIFESIASACAALPEIAATGAAAIELLDDASLRALPPEALKPWLMVQKAEGLHDGLSDSLPQAAPELPTGACALLTEFQAATPAKAEAQAAQAAELVEKLPLLAAARFTRDPDEQAALWKLRKGLYPSIGAVRKSGSTVLIEDVVFPLARLAEGVAGLHRLFARHGYAEAIIFGHAKDGNLHFVITQSFNSQAEVARYDGLMRDLTALVLELGGALKAEHGTGRNMAPFVEAEWGPEAYALMTRLKALIDPDNLLNPGVIINADPEAHLKHLKTLPSVDPEVDKCTECGFCEPACPSRRVTTTPRQRIVLRREMQRLEQANETDKLAELVADYQYAGIETCAADSLCSLACPIGIDTGALIKRLRSEAVPDKLQHQVSRLSKGFARLETGLKLGLGSGHLADKVLGERGLNWIIRQGEKLTGTRLPAWDHRLPPPNLEALPQTAEHGAQYVYFPSCLSRTLSYADGRDLPHTLIQLCGRAGVRVWLPPESQGQCCGLPFSSKGFAEAGAQMAERSLARFWSWSRHGRLPIVVDTSPCTLQLKQALAKHPDYARIRLLDSVEFLAMIADKLPLRQRQRKVALHPVCSLRKLGAEAELVSLARRCASEVIVPPSAGCCGYAGDRGLLYPELPAAALHDEKAELAAFAPDICCSSSRSCEMGLSLETGQAFVSILHLLADSLDDKAGSKA